MSGFPILDLVVGLIFIYFLLSIVSSSALEIVLTVFKLRAVMLEKWLLTIFSKPYNRTGAVPAAGATLPKLGEAIADHCSVTALSGKSKAPSYIDAKNFSAALLEKITYDPTNLKNFTTLANSIPSGIDSFVDAINTSALLDEELKHIFLGYAAEAKHAISTTESQIDIFRKKIEAWYDMSMDRVGGALKTRYTRRITFALAVVTAVALNADSISIAKYLYSNPEARVKLATKAYATVDSLNKVPAKKADTAKTDTAGRDTVIKSQQNTDSGRPTVDSLLAAKIVAFNKARATLDDALPLGWKAGECNENGKVSGRLVFMKIIGLAATVLAIMMGAPFWFDLLNKISNLRGVGAKPASATDKKK